MIHNLCLPVVAMAIAIPYPILVPIPIPNPIHCFRYLIFPT